MDIQKLRQEFEKLPDIKGILYGSEFGFNESLNEYYHPDHTNHRLNYAFIMGAWMAWKAQTVPEGFVLVPKEPLYLVWNNGKSECVGFMNKCDAKYASTGVSYSCGVSTIAESFRETYEADEQDFIITEVMVEVGEN